MSEASGGSPTLFQKVFRIAFAVVAWIALIAGFLTAVKHTMENQSEDKGSATV